MATNTLALLVVTAVMAGGGGHALWPFNGDSPQATSIGSFFLGSTYGNLVETATGIQTSSAEIQTAIAASTNTTAATTKSDPVNAFQLPRIIVVGEESAGKSSTLERIVGFSFFPMDKFQCTRMPIRLQLRYQATTAPLVSLVRATTPATPGTATAVPGIDSKVSRDMVATRIAEIMATVSESFTSKRDVSPVELVVTVRGPDVPSIDLVDLPGMIGAANEAESQHLSKNIDNLITTYVTDPAQTTFVLAVFRGTQPRGGRGLKLLQDLGALPNTIGVVTFINQVHPNVEEYPDEPYREMKDLLEGDAEIYRQYLPQLGGGYVGVIGRNSRNPKTPTLDITREEKAEREWFNEHIPTLGVDIGVTAILARVEAKFTPILTAKWIPQQAASLASLAKQVQAAIKALGPSPDEIKDNYPQLFNGEHAKSLFPANPKADDAWMRKFYVGGGLRLVAVDSERCVVDVEATTIRIANYTMIISDFVGWAYVDLLVNLYPEAKLDRFPLLREGIHSQLGMCMLDQESKAKALAWRLAHALHALDMRGEWHEINSGTQSLDLPDKCTLSYMVYSRAPEVVGRSTRRLFGECVAQPIEANKSGVPSDSLFLLGVKDYFNLETLEDLAYNVTRLQDTLTALDRA